MNVLSLFDGMSCGRIALEKAGIEIDKYYASEIKKHAIKCSQHNFPDNIQIGCIYNVGVQKQDKIDLVIGGSPCQDFSIGSKERKGLKGSKSSLFYEYLRVLEQAKKANPKVKFLLENVVMEQEYQDVISELLGVKPIFIDSIDFSFQTRKRLYWTNIEVNDWDKKKIDFQDFKDNDFDYCEKFKVNRTPSREIMWQCKCPNVTNRSHVNCLTVKQDRWNNSGLVEHGDFCRYLTTRELELAQTVPIGYTNCVSQRQAEDLLGDGWTVDVIAHIFKGLNTEQNER